MRLRSSSVVSTWRALYQSTRGHAYPREILCLCGAARCELCELCELCEHEQFFLFSCVRTGYRAVTRQKEENTRQRTWLSFPPFAIYGSLRRLSGVSTRNPRRQPP